MEKLQFNPKDGKTIFEPEGKGAGYWIGASTLYYDKELEKFFMFLRIRNPRPIKGKVYPHDTRRGYKSQILESHDGVNFKPIWELRKHQIKVKSMEGAALIKIKDKYHLFFCYESHSLIPRWQTRKIVAEHPSEFNINDIEKINWNLRFPRTLGYKDPKIYEFNGKYFLYVDYFRFWKKPWGSTAVFKSTDGDKFKWAGNVFQKSKKCKWTIHELRLTGLVQYKENQYIGFIDGTDKRSEVCEEKSGIAMGQTPYKLRIMSCDGPAYYSDYGKGSVRYLFGLIHDHQLWIYYEYTEKEGEHVLKLMKIEI